MKWGYMDNKKCYPHTPIFYGDDGLKLFMYKTYLYWKRIRDNLPVQECWFFYVHDVSFLLHSSYHSLLALRYSYRHPVHLTVSARILLKCLKNHPVCHKITSFLHFFISLIVILYQIKFYFNTNQ